MDIKAVQDAYKPENSVKDVFLDSRPEIVFKSNLDALKAPIDIFLQSILPLPDVLAAAVQGTPYNLVIYDQDDISKLSVYVPKYNGSLGSLLSEIAESAGLFIRFDSGIISVFYKDTFSVDLTGYADIDKYIEKQISALGATKIGFDIQLNKLVFTADKRSYNKIKEYLSALSRSFSYISLHLILIDLDETGLQTHGIDIYKSGVSINNLQALTGGYKIKNSSDGSFNLLGGANINLFLYWLKQYSHSKILQNVHVGVVNTYTGKIESNQKIPYVDKVNISTTTAGSQQGIEIKEVDSGSMLEYSVKYDINDNLLSVDLNVVYQNIIRFVSLSTGFGGLSITRPVVNKRFLNTRFVSSPEDFLILGGISSDSEISTFDGIDTLNIGMDKTTLNKSRLVILIKPEITRFIYKR